MNEINENNQLFLYLATFDPVAKATIRGGDKYQEIHGVVEFYNLLSGVIVVANINSLPRTSTNIFAFHIHNGINCNDDFMNTGTHYNPTNQPHPMHKGDLPPIFANNGFAWSVFLDQRFTINEVIGKTVIIHDKPDDFTTQPAGNSGEKIACGVIELL